MPVGWASALLTVTVANLELAAQAHGGLVETDSAQPTPEFPIQCWVWGLRICVSNKFLVVVLLLLSEDHTLRTTVLGKMPGPIIHGPKPAFLEWLLLVQGMKGQK